jgi:hypothetical protein
VRTPARALYRSFATCAWPALFLNFPFSTLICFVLFCFVLFYSSKVLFCCTGCGTALQLTLNIAAPRHGILPQNLKTSTDLQYILHKAAQPIVALT